MANKWLQHLANFRRQNRNIDAGEVMKQARASYRGGTNTKTMGSPSPYVNPMQNTMGQVKGAMDDIKMKGGNAVVPYETTSTESTPSKVGGRRSRRQSRKRSRRTRRR
jgi:hypothetical protein